MRLPMNKCLRICLGLVILVPMLCSIKPAAADENTIEQATRNANSWLAMIDGGNYSETWAQTSAFFQKRVSITEWHRQISFGRQPLGSFISRILAHTESATSLPGAPDGHYVVLQYIVSFAHSKVLVETLTMMPDVSGQSGQWRVADYLMQ